MRGVFSRLSRVHACVPIKAIEPFSLLVCRSIRFASAHSSVHRRWAASAIFSVLFWKGFIITYVQGRNINASSLIGVDSITPNFQVNLNVRRWFFKWSYISQTCSFLLLSQWARLLQTLFLVDLLRCHCVMSQAEKRSNRLSFAVTENQAVLSVYPGTLL